MNAFPTPCAKPGCGTACYTRFCDGHTRQRTGRPSRRKAVHRGGAGYGAKHIRWRKIVLSLDPCCHWPLEAGRRCLEPGEIADHILPKAAHPELAYDPANGQSLCRTHHAKKTAEEKKKIFRNTRTETAGA